MKYIHWRSNNNRKCANVLSSHTPDYIVLQQVITRVRPQRSSTWNIIEPKIVKVLAIHCAVILAKVVIFQFWLYHSLLYQQIRSKYETLKHKSLVATSKREHKRTSHANIHHSLTITNTQFTCIVRYTFARDTWFMVFHNHFHYVCVCYRMRLLKMYYCS